MGSLPMAALIRLLATPLLLVALLAAVPPAPAAPPTDAVAELNAARQRAAELTEQGRYKAAIILAEKALKRGEAAFGPQAVDTATLANELAHLYELQGRYTDAEKNYKRAVDIATKALGWKDISVANGLANLANIYRLQERFVEAQRLYKRVIALGTRILGPEHPDLAVYFNNLAQVHRAQGRISEAEELYGRAMTLIVKSRGADDPGVAATVNNLASLYFDLGRYDQAERALQQTITVLEDTYGADHPQVATGLHNLAWVYINRGNYRDGERLLRRAIDIKKDYLGPDHPSLATSLHGLATLYFEQARYDQARPLLERALAIRTAVLGTGSRDVAEVQNNLALIHLRQGRLDEAERLLKRVREIMVRVLGEEHIDVAVVLVNLAEISGERGDHEQAERLHRQALAIREKTFGDRHPDVAQSLWKLAVVLRAAGRHREALDFARRATAIYRTLSSELSRQKSTGALTEQARRRPSFLTHVGILVHHLEAAPANAGALTAEAFEVAQLARATGTAKTLARMSARFAAGNDELAASVRGRQDALERWRQLDAALLEALSRPPSQRAPAEERRLRAEKTALAARLAALDKLLAEEFPDYAELVSLRPARLDEVQTLLRPDEALLAYLIGEKASYVWAVRHDRAALIRLDIGGAALRDQVTTLRAALDPFAVRSFDDLLSFEFGKAFQLYQQIFAPAQPMLDGVRHVIVVPDGPLQSLPFSVLITRPGAAKLPSFAAYRNVAWLAKDYAFTVLPAVNALRALRRIASATRATRPLIGFGDPLLGGEAGTARATDASDLYGQGGLVNTEAVRSLPRLPETADELRELARYLKAGEETLHLQIAASESNLYEMDRAGVLKDYRIVAFATHALAAGEFAGTVEPALVLTPPEAPGDPNDGLLTASEITGLKLDADWVILSACNTAAPDGTPGAEGLSGLAKAFFYAGSRALLVSHWAVASDATERLITGIFAAAAADPGISRAEALRRSMLGLLADDEIAYFGHPIFWAPFIVVGEGGAGVRG
jgi:CHAT domain-containing protein/Tfp pilus assembly protein PilF